jgi:hypothetical protein
MTYEIRAMSLLVNQVNEPQFSEMATEVKNTDEAGGEYVEVVQEVGKIQITPEEWPALRKAIDMMISGCREKPK